MTFRLWYTDDSGQERQVAFDGVLSETLEAVAELTEHAVERGSNVVDHHRTSPRTFGIEALVTNTPIKDPTPGAELGRFESFETLDVPTYSPPVSLTPGGVNRLAQGAVGAVGNLLTGGPPPLEVVVTRFAGQPFDRIKDVAEELEKIQSGAFVIRLETSFRELENIQLVRFTPTRKSEDGSSAAFQLDFRQIKIVETATVAAPLVAEALGALRSKGAPKALDAAAGGAAGAAAKQSLAKAGISSLTGGDGPLAELKKFF